MTSDIILDRDSIVIEGTSGVTIKGDVSMDKLSSNADITCHTLKVRGDIQFWVPADLVSFPDVLGGRPPPIPAHYESIVEQVKKLQTKVRALEERIEALE